MNAHEIPELDARGLRNFALTTGAILAVLFGLLVPWLFGARLPVWPWAVAVVLGGWGLAHPTGLRPVYHLWMKFGLLLNKVTTPLILGLLFFFLFTPIALVMRIIGRDTMHRQLDPEVDSYRHTSRRRDRKSMENPF